MLQLFTHGTKVWGAHMSIIAAGGLGCALLDTGLLLFLIAETSKKQVEAFHGYSPSPSLSLAALNGSLGSATHLKPLTSVISLVKC